MLGAIAEAGGELISCSIFCVEVDVLLFVFARSIVIGVYILIIGANGTSAGTGVVIG